MKSSPVSLGVDIGGTKIAAGIVDASGRILFQARVPMVTDGDAEAGLEAVLRAIQEVRNAAGGMQVSPVAIGICSPGPLDPSRGIVLNPPNLPCWRNFPLSSAVQAACSLPVRVDNDGNAAALAEAVWGSGAGYRNVFYATLGTGVGAGIIFDRQIYHGRTGSAAEGGHLSINYRGPHCQCGKRGCIEAYCSGPAIARRAQALLAEAPQGSLMLELAAGNIEQVRADIVGEAFHRGDPLATEVLRETADLLAVWLGNVIDLLEPDVLIAGGGLSELISCFFPYINEQLPRHCINQRSREIPLLRAKYGAEAGIAGGAALFWGKQAQAAGQDANRIQDIL
jgi:glucokinase